MKQHKHYHYPIYNLSTTSQSTVRTSNMNLTTKEIEAQLLLLKQIQGFQLSAIFIIDYLINKVSENSWYNNPKLKRYSI